MQRCDLQLQVIWRPLALPCKVYSHIATNLRCGGGYLDLGFLYVLPASTIHFGFKKLHHFRSFGKTSGHFYRLEVFFLSRTGEPASGTQYLQVMKRREKTQLENTTVDGMISSFA